MPPEADLFAFERGSITAPAGCGKTQLITDSVHSYQGSKPILILTHTNAGRAALSQRMRRAGVRASAYRVKTIDGFAMRLIGLFPTRSGHDPALLEVNNPRHDHPAIRMAALQLLRSQHISAAIRATYGRLIVDEYQDCNLVQHQMIDALAVDLPTAVLGDPMQAIFGFSGTRLVSWEQDVEALFPSRGELRTPWRWRNAGTEALGDWLVEIRQVLLAGRPIDLRRAPAEVQWIRLEGDDADGQRRAAAQTRMVGDERSVLIIGDSTNPAARHRLTSQTPGAISVEAVDFQDLMTFARRFTPEDEQSAKALLDFAGEVMTQVRADELIRRVRSIRGGRSRTPATPAEMALCRYVEQPSFSAGLDVLDHLENQGRARVFRPDLLRCCRSAMRLAAKENKSLLESAMQARERSRHNGRPVGRRAVGSTLLLKGLEADVAVIMNPEAMDERNLYVALTRAARRILVCSSTHLLPSSH